MARSKGRARRRAPRGGAGAAVILLCLLGLSACDGLPGGVDCDEFRFDRESWGLGPDPERDPPTPRQRIADALVECRLLDGRTRAEVLRTLRPPDGQAAAGAGDAWTLGPERGYGVDDESLEVRYDADGRVRRVEIVQG